MLLVSTARGIPLYGPSGASAHLRGVAGALRRAGHAVCVAVPSLTDARGTFGEPVDAEVVTLGGPPGRGPAREFADARRLLALCPRDVDLVWARHALYTDAAPRFARAIGAPCWLEVNAPLTLERDLEGGAKWRFAVEALERHQIAAADRVLAVSRWLVAWATSVGGRRVNWLPNGTDTPPATKPRPRRDGLVLGFVGSCAPWHRLDRLPALLELLPDAHGRIIGDGAAVPRHPRLTAARATDVAAALDAVDVGVLLGTRPWACPLKIADYRARGVPVLSVPFPGADAVIGEGGLSLPFGPEWATAARRLAAAPPRPFVRSWDHVVAEAFATDG